MRKFITTRAGLRRATGEAIGALFAGAVLIGLALYFRSNIAGYLGETVAMLVTWIVIGILVLTFSGWVRIRKEEAGDKRQQAERKRDEEQNKAEWDAFINWVRQHPVTAERLMRIVDDDAQWRAERREAAGGLSRVAKMEHRNAPMDLQQFYTATDLNRLFDWLKAQRDLKEFGLDIDLSSRPKG
jgi:hypothetical protein